MSHGVKDTARAGCFRPREAVPGEGEGSVTRGVWGQEVDGAPFESPWLLCEVEGEVTGKNEGTVGSRRGEESGEGS